MLRVTGQTKVVGETVLAGWPKAALEYPLGDDQGGRTKAPIYWW
jgi:hypothetical protein